MPQGETNADAIRGAEVFGVSKVSQRANPSQSAGKSITIQGPKDQSPTSAVKSTMEVRRPNVRCRTLQSF